MSKRFSTTLNKALQLLTSSASIHLIIIIICVLLIFTAPLLSKGYLLYADSIPFSLNEQSFNNIANYLYTEKMLGLLPNPVYILNSFFIHKLFVVLNGIFNIPQLTVLAILIPFLLQNIVIYFCFRSLFRNQLLSLLLTSIYMFSLTSFDLLFTGSGPIWSNSGGFIFLIAFVQYLHSRKLQYLFYMILASVVGAMNLAFFYCVIVACVIYYIIFIYINPSISLKSHLSLLKNFLIVGVGIMLINQYWILPLLSNQNIIADSYMSDNSLLFGRSELASPLKNLQFSYIFKYEPFFGTPYRLYNSGFYLITFFAFLIFTLNKIIGDVSNKLILPLFSTFLFLLSISLGVNFIFWDFFSRIPGWFFFRDPIRLVYLLYFIWLSMLGLSLKKNLTKVARMILLCYLCITVLIFGFSNIWGYYNKNELPEDYFTVKKFLSNSENENRTVLILPEFRWYVSYLWMSNQYFLPIITENLLANPLIMSFISRSRVPEYFSEYFDKNSFSEEDSIRLGRAGVKYILLHKDIVLLEGKEITNIKSIKKVIDGDNITLYEVDDINYYPNIYTTTISEFERVNPTKYNLNIRLSDNSKLIFNQPYNNNWKLFPSSADHIETCQMYKFNKNSKECYRKEKFFEGEELSYLLKKSFLPRSHKKYDDYSNIWTIDKESIIKNMDPKSYIKHTDGSLTVSLTLYYLPQSYFYLGVIITTITLTFLLSSLIFLKRSE